jgi:hypothetical protein
MFARVATFDGIDLESMGPVMEWWEEHGSRLNEQFAGYQGALSLLDRENRRGIEILLFDTEPSARKADEILDAGLPEDMPEELKEIMMRTERSYRGVLEVADVDGRLRDVVQRAG